MAVDRPSAALFGRVIEALYRRAGLRVLRILADLFTTGPQPTVDTVRSGAWQRAMAAQEAAAMARVNAVLAEALRDARAYTPRVFTQAAAAGQQAADADLAAQAAQKAATVPGGPVSAPGAAAGGPEPVARPQRPVNTRALQALQRDLEGRLRGLDRPVLRGSMDLYRRTVAQVAEDVIAGRVSQQTAARHAIRAMRAQGITGFTDRAGRRWTLERYTTMAVRTAASRAHTNAAIERWTDLGVGLATVNDSVRECPQCRPYERKVLALTATADAAARQAGIPDYAGTLDAAVANGLLHPGCRHSLHACVTE